MVRITGIAAGCSILVMDGGGAKTRVGMGGDLTSGGTSITQSSESESASASVACNKP